MNAILQATVSSEAADDVKQALWNSMGTQKLLERMNSIFTAYMQQIRGPQLLAAMHLEMCRAGKLLKGLGPAPDSSSVATILQELQSRVRAESNGEAA